MQLPQETLDTIIDAVACGSDASQVLSAVALTCRAFLPRCRLHQFKVVRFTRENNYGTQFSYPRPNSSPLQALLALLTESPARAGALGAPIGAFVQTLKISNNLNPLIIQITAQLPNLKTLIVKTECDDMEVRHFAEYEAMHDAAGVVIGSNKSTTPSTISEVRTRVSQLDTFVPPSPLAPLKLESLHIRQSIRAQSLTTFNFISRCLHLQAKRYTQQEIKAGAQCTSHNTARTVTVGTLAVYGVFGWLDHMLQFRHTREALEKLKAVNIGLSDLRRDALRTPRRLFSLVGNTLVSLELNLSDSKFVREARRELPLHLPSLPNLKQLALINWPRSPDQPLFAFPREIISLLSPYETVYSVLETIRITLVWKKWDLEAPWDEDGSWERARQMVLGCNGGTPPGFRHLRQFNVSVAARKGKPVTDPREKVRAFQKLNDLFNLADSGIVGSIACNMVKI